MDGNIGKNISVSLSSKYTQKNYCAKHSATDTLKLFQRKQFKKQWKQSVIWLALK